MKYFLPGEALPEIWTSKFKKILNFIGWCFAGKPFLIGLQISETGHLMFSCQWKSDYRYLRILLQTTSISNYSYDFRLPNWLVDEIQSRNWWITCCFGLASDFFPCGHSSFFWWICWRGRILCHQRLSDHFDYSKRTGQQSLFIVALLWASVPQNFTGFAVGRDRINPAIMALIVTPAIDWFWSEFGCIVHICFEYTFLDRNRLLWHGCRI